MEWVIVAIVVVGMVLAISIAGRQRAAVRTQEDRLRRLEAKIDAITAGQPPQQPQPPADSYPADSYPADPYQGSSYPTAYPGTFPATDPGLDPRLDEVRRLARDGRKIEAIKVYREVTNAGLKEAKDAVERMFG